MTRAQRDAERAAVQNAARRRGRDDLRARIMILEPMLDALNAAMRDDACAEDPIRAEMLFAPGEDDLDATLPRAIEIRTPAGVACRLGIASYEAVLKLEWLLGRPVPYRVFDSIDTTEDGPDVVLTSRGGRALSFAYVLYAVEERVMS